MSLHRALVLALVSLAACSPSDFDGLTGGRSQPIDSAIDDTLDARVGDEAGLDGSVEELDGSLDAELSDTGVDSALMDAAVDAGPLLDDAGCPLVPTVRPFALRGQPTELATLENPAAISTRRLHASLAIGSQRVWLFGETRTNTARVPLQPSNYPSAALQKSAAPWLPGWSPASAWTLSEASAAPLPFVLLREVPDINAIPSMAPSGLFIDPTAPNKALAYVVKGVWSVPTEVSLAVLSAPYTQATLPNPALFTGAEAFFPSAPIVDATHVQFFACRSANNAVPCKLYRAPIAQLAVRAAYQAAVKQADDSWRWESNLAAATTVIEDGTEGFSLSFNKYLQQYVAVHSAGFSPDITVRTASRLEGPWTTSKIRPPSMSKVWGLTDARELPDLAQSCGRRIIVSHWMPTKLWPADAGPVSGYPELGDTVLTAIDLE